MKPTETNMCWFDGLSMTVFMSGQHGGTHSHCVFLKPFWGCNGSRHLEEISARVCTVETWDSRYSRTVCPPLTCPNMNLSMIT